MDPSQHRLFRRITKCCPPVLHPQELPGRETIALTQGLMTKMPREQNSLLEFCHYPVFPIFTSHHPNPTFFPPRVKRFSSQHQRGPNRLRSSWDSKSSSRKISQALSPSKSTQQNKPRYLPQGVLLLQPLFPEVALSQTVGGTMENGPSGKLGNC